MKRSGSRFSYVDLEERVGKEHPLRIIRGIVNEALAALSDQFRRCICGAAGRRSRQKRCCGQRRRRPLFDPLGAAVMERLEFDLLVSLVRRDWRYDTAWVAPTCSRPS